MAPTDLWNLDEMVVKIGGQRMYLRRAVDDEGDVLDMRFQSAATPLRPKSFRGDS